MVYDGIKPSVRGCRHAVGDCEARVLGSSWQPQDVASWHQVVSRRHADGSISVSRAAPRGDGAIPEPAQHVQLRQDMVARMTAVFVIRPPSVSKEVRSV